MKNVQIQTLVSLTFSKIFLDIFFFKCTPVASIFDLRWVSCLADKCGTLSAAA